MPATACMGHATKSALPKHLITGGVHTVFSEAYAWTRAIGVARVTHWPSLGATAKSTSPLAEALAGT